MKFYRRHKFDFSIEDGAKNKTAEGVVQTPSATLGWLERQ
jgi:hypothetical protein